MPHDKDTQKLKSHRVPNGWPARNDFGEAKSDHHKYNRGSMSDAEPYNEYNRHDEKDYGSESRQSYGRGYGADNSYESGYNAQQVFGRTPNDHAYAANPGPQVERPYLDQKLWDQDTGTWHSQEDMYQSPPNEGKNVNH